jgi:molybdenum ABC transporter molybdate-binding protein
VHVPCVLSGPVQKVISAYEATGPNVEVSVAVDKPMAMLAAAQEPQDTPGVVITTGLKEMETLVAAGAVLSKDVRAIAVNTYPIVVVAAADAVPELKTVRDLANPAVKTIYLEDPAKSSMGARAVEGLQQLGLWDAISAKVVQPHPNAMVLGDLIDRKADAAIVFRDCLFGESGGNPPKTVRIVGEIPQGDLPPIGYQAGVLAHAPDRELGQAFVDFLVSAQGKEALREAGLTPPQ